MTSLRSEGFLKPGKAILVPLMYFCRGKTRRQLNSRQTRARSRPSAHLGVLQVLEQSLVGPRDAALLVGLGVRIALDGAGSAANDAPQVRALLVGSALRVGVALGTGRQHGRFAHPNQHSFKKMASRP